MTNSSPELVCTLAFPFEVYSGCIGVTYRGFIGCKLGRLYNMVPQVADHISRLKPNAIPV